MGEGWFVRSFVLFGVRLVVFFVFFLVLRGVVVSWCTDGWLLLGFTSVRMFGLKCFPITTLWGLEREIERKDFVEMDGLGLLEVVNSSGLKYMPVLRVLRTDANGLVTQYMSQSTALIPDVSRR